MTTPRDAIGLSERLRRRAAVTEYCTGDPLCEEAATQLDSLLKERDALQARVKELEGIVLCHAEASETRRRWQQWAEDERAKYEARALRAQQERDTLARVMEDTANELGREPNNEVILETILRLQQERDEAYERAAIYIEQREGMIPDWRGFVAELRSLAAGPEKEKKE